MMLALAVPLYNEGPLVDAVVADILAAMAGRPLRLALVDNGSTDQTRERVQAWADHAPEQVLPVLADQNQGYGGGILLGLEALLADPPVVAAADRAAIGWAWGDGQVDPAVLPVLLDQLDDGADIAKARRTSRQDGWRRRGITTAYALVTRAMGMRTRDVNGCPKLMRVSTLRQLAPTHRDWFLDPELVFAAEQAQLRIADTPVVMRARTAGKSHVRWATVWEFATNLGKLRTGR